MDCQYHADGLCTAIGDLCGTAPVRVAPRTCELCSASTKPGPRQQNSITASAAIVSL